MNPLSPINPITTALVIIDLQKGITTIPTLPHSSDKVISNAVNLVNSFHSLEAQVIFVRVAFAPDGKNALRPDADEAGFNMTNLPKDWADIVPAFTVKENDIIITKRQWGAFYGTELDLELRRRGIKTIVLAGISTNFGVESTARDAYERGYQIIFAEDAMASRSAEDHEFAIKRIFPRIGKIRKTNEVLEAL